MSPSLRPVWMFGVAGHRRARSALRAPAWNPSAHGPGAHSIFSALRPCIAAQVLSATTATPAARLRDEVAGRVGPAIGTTARTPRIFFAAESSSDFSVPSKYGQRAMTANNMPGICASMP